MENPFETINQQLAEITRQIGSIAAELSARRSVDGTKSSSPKSDYIDLNEAAAITSYSVHSLRRFVSNKSLPSYHIGGKVRFREKELRDWLDARARRSAPADEIGIIAAAPARGTFAARRKAKQQQQTTPMDYGN